MLAGALLAVAFLQLHGAVPRADWRSYFPGDLLKYELPCPLFPSHSPPNLPFTADGLAWRAGQLEAAGEAPLLKKGRSDVAIATYRFTYLRTFNPPVIVRLDEMRSGAWRLTGKRLTGKGGYEPGVIDASEDRLLTPDQTRLVKQGLRTYDALKLPPATCAPMMTDGAEWMFETRTAAGYRLAREQSPSKGPLRALGLMFLGLSSVSGLPIY